MIAKEDAHQSYRQQELSKFNDTQMLGKEKFSPIYYPQVVNKIEA